MKKILFALLAAAPLFAAAQPKDWANYGRYAEANARLEKAPDVVFMGNSITDGWDDRGIDASEAHSKLSFLLCVALL